VIAFFFSAMLKSKEYGHKNRETEIVKSYTEDAFPNIANDNGLNAGVI
jgi:hypothetical protein